MALQVTMSAKAQRLREYLCTRENIPQAIIMAFDGHRRSIDTSKNGW